MIAVCGPFEVPGRSEHMEPVKLLHFTPLCTDYGDQSYGLGSLSGAASGCSLTGHGLPTESQNDLALSVNAAMDTTSSMSCPLHSPYDYMAPESCQAYNSLSMEHSSSYCSGQEHMQSSRSVSSLASALSIPSAQEYNAELGMLMDNTSLSDFPPVGPPPARLPRLEGAMTADLGPKESNYSPRNPLLHAHAGYNSSPHSPSSATDTHHHKYSKNRNKSPRNMVMRSTSPLFPDQSIPLSSLSRQPSIRSADQHSLFSVSVKSDPDSYSYTTNITSDSAIDSPSISVGQDSPRFEFAISNSGSKMQANIETSSRSCLALEMPTKYAREINEIDKKIWKLQVERSKVLEKVHYTKSSGTGPAVHAGQADMNALLLSDKPSDMEKIHLYIFPLGIHELDDPLYDDASKLLRLVGGLFLDLQNAIHFLKTICCKGMFLPSDIKTCFVYIRSLLKEGQKLKLSETQGLFRILLDVDGGNSNGGLSEPLRAANEVLRCAQHITLLYTSTQMQLQKLCQIASGKANSCDETCQKLGILDRKRRNQFRAVLDGNCTTMASAERVWPQYYQIAMETISSITECIHPSTII